MIYKPFKQMMRTARHVQKLTKTLHRMPTAMGDYVGAMQKIGGIARQAIADHGAAVVSGMVHGRIGGPGGERSYFLYVPNGYSRTHSVPLVLMLHGCGQSPVDFAIGTRMNQAAEERGWLVVYPGQIAKANQAGCWNWFLPGHQKRGRGEPKMFAALIDLIAMDYAVDRNRVYVAGLSAGGAMAALLGQAYPDVFAAVGVHSGLPCTAARDPHSALSVMRAGPPGGAKPLTRLMPMIVFHGDQDRTVHPSNADQLIAQAKRRSGWQAVTIDGLATDGTPCRLTRYENATGVPMLEQWLVRGLGHAWSGGNGAGSFADRQGPDATADMLYFFQQHARQETR